MVKLKFWSIYSHIETSVIKIMRDIHANTLFVVKFSKKAPSQAKWWDLSDLHIQNLGEIDKIWVSVKIWMIQYNLSFCIRTENTSKTLLLELPFATIRMQSYYSYSAVTGKRMQNLTKIKTKWAIRNMGKHRNFCHPHPRGQEFVLPETSSSSCDNVTCCDHWPVERDTQWSHAPLSLVTRLPWGDLCPASQWPLLSAHGFKLTPVICHLSSRTSGETKPFKAPHQEYQTGQGWDRDMPVSHPRWEWAWVMSRMWCFHPKSGILLLIFDRSVIVSITNDWVRERVGMMLHILHNITKYPD